MKKNITIAAGLIFVILLVFYLSSQNSPDGSSIEGREMILNKQSKINGNAHITNEITIDDYIVSGFICSDNKHGLAIFKPKGNGRYQFQTKYLREEHELINGHVMTNKKYYDLFWASKEDLAYAEVTYKVSNKSEETIKLDATENKIVYNEAPSGDYGVEYVFVDMNGRRYE